ncbi:MAG: phosphatase PAP2 family protein [Aquihabitans sp.]
MAAWSEALPSVSIMSVAMELSRRTRARLDPDGRYGLRLPLAVVAVLLVVVPFAYLTYAVQGTGPLIRLDGRVADQLNAWVYDSPGFVTAMKWVSRLAEATTLWVIVALAVGLVWRPGRQRICIFLMVTTLGWGIINSLVKEAVGRPRPVVDHPVTISLSKSFPSGHTMGATVVFGALLVAFWMLMPPRWRGRALIATIVLVLAVACSRLLLGVHFLTDVVGGFLLGLAWLLAMMAVFAPWRLDQPVDAVTPDVPDREP